MKETSMIRERLTKYYDKKDVNLAFVNGRFAPEFSNLDHAPEGIRLSKNGAVIRIKGKTTFPGVIHLLHITKSNGEQASPALHHDMTIEESGEATILESYLTFDENLSYATDTASDITLKKNAVLHYCTAQSESRKASHKGRTHVSQEKDSCLESFALMTGSDNARNDLKVSLNGEGAQAHLNGLYLTDGHQKTENTTFLEHRAPRTTSRQLYKGILTDASKAVFSGKILVHADAQQTNAYQLNKNLLLGKDCQVDTTPQLEIFADDVKCTHGATISQLNEEEIFYLKSRGIDKESAVRMLMRSFVTDILSTIRSESISRKFNVLLEPILCPLTFPSKATKKQRGPHA